ncbi:hypothetical protein L0152_29210 [bacterium]|nr:hypothetical protein [bacterium]
MRAVYLLIVLLFSSLVAAEDIVIMSYLNNSTISGSQLCASIVLGPNSGAKVCKDLPSAGGLTSIQNTISNNELHVFYNMRPNSNGPIKIFRDTLTLEPFQFVSGRTRTFFNTNGFLNFDIHNRLSTSQRVANRVDTRALNNSNNFTGLFQRLAPYFGSPYSTAILNESDGPFATTLFRGAGTNPDGVTFRNLRTNSNQTYAFTGPQRVLNIDKLRCPSAERELLALLREDHPGQPRRVSTSIRRFDSQDFSTIGNQVRVDPPRPDPNPNSFNTSCLGGVRLVTPTGTNEFHGVALYNRHRPSGNTYDWYSRLYRCGDNVVPVGGARRVVTNQPNTNSYGCSATTIILDNPN